MTDHDAVTRASLFKAIEKHLNTVDRLVNAKVAGKGREKYLFESSFRTIMNRNLRAALTEVRQWQMVGTYSPTEEK